MRPGFHGRCDCRSPAKAKTINKYLGPGYEVLRLRARARSPRQGRLGAPGRRFLHGLGGRSEVEQAALRHRLGREARRARDPRHRPGSRGRGDIWHVLQVCAPRTCCAASRSTVSCSRRHPPSGAGGDEEPARDRRAAGRCAPRAASTISWASRSPVLWRAWRALGRPRVQSVALRLVCDREAEIERFGRRNTGRSSRISARSGTIPSARLVVLDGEEAGSAGDRRRGRRERGQAPSREFDLHRRVGGIEAAAPQSAAPFIRLNASAASENSASMPATRCASLSASTRVSISGGTPSD